jgi:hypothetical protein
VRCSVRSAAVKVTALLTLPVAGTSFSAPLAAAVVGGADSADIADSADS